MLNLREFKKVPDSVSDLLPWAALITSAVVLNKDGSLQASIRYRGPDLDSATPEELVASAAQINNILSRLGTGWAIYAESRRVESREYCTSDWDSTLCELIDLERQRSFFAQAHFESEYFLTLVYIPESESVQRFSSKFLTKDSKKSTYDRVLETFCHEIDKVVKLLERIFPEAKLLVESELLTYLHGTISSKLHPVKLPDVPMYLDSLLSDTPLLAGIEPMLGEEYLACVGIKGFPSSSFPGLLDSLNRLPLKYRWVNRFIALQKVDAVKELETFKRKWFAKRKGMQTLIKELCTKEESALSDNEAMQKASDADAALRELSQEAMSYGYFTGTIVLTDRDKDRLNQYVLEVERIINELGFVTIRESINAVDSWLGTIPGNCRHNVRRPIISTINLTHLLPGASAVWAGPVRDEHFKASPLFYAKTHGATPFRYSLHVGDTGHTLVLGPTGAGKSVFLNYLEASFMRYENAQVYIFDKGGSARAITAGVGGDFYDLCSEKSSLTLQPLSAVHEESERRWAHEWIIDILIKENVTITPDVKATVWRALCDLSSAPADQRTIFGLTVFLQNELLRNALTQYTNRGPFGKLLDNTHDTLSYRRWQCFEMENLMNTPSVVVPVLSYLFHRLEQRFTGAPTLLVLDEAWLFLDHPTFAAKIREWLKVLRKANVSVVFATQSLADIHQSSIAETIREACFTKVYLPNSIALQPDTSEFYRKFGLNQRQIAIISQALPKRDYYYVSPSGCRLFSLELGELALAYCAATSKEKQRAIQEILDSSQSSEEFNQQYLKFCKLDWALDSLSYSIAQKEAA